MHPQKFWSLRRQVWLSLAGATFWLFVAGSLGSPRWVFAPNWHDHVSNLSSTYLFLIEGFDIYKKPVGSFVEPWAPREIRPEQLLDLDPDGMFFHPKVGEKTPLYLVWPNATRPYPVLAWLYYSPFAVMHFYVGLPLRWTLALEQWVFLLVAHVVFFLLWSFVQPKSFTVSEPPFTRILRFFVAATAYAELIFWSGNGQYDAIALVPVFMGFHSLDRGRSDNGLFWWAISLLTHFRALLISGAACFAFLHFNQNRSKLNLRLVGISLALAGFGAWQFLMGLENLTDTKLYQHNRWYLMGSQISWASSETWMVLTAIGLVSGLLIYQRAWLTLATFASALLMLSLSPQIRAWYVLFALPLFVTPILDQKRRTGLPAPNENPSHHWLWGYITNPLFMGLLAYALVAGLIPNHSPFDMTRFRI